MKGLKHLKRKFSFFSQWILFIKGLLIGGAIIIPGVSGGTIALITGLYPSIISALSSFHLRTIFKKEEFLKFFQAFSYLSPVLIGALLGFFVTIQWISFLIHSHPFPTYSLLSGIILTSTPFLFKQMKINKMEILIFLSSAILSFSLSFFNSFFFSGSVWLFLSIYLAVGAMLIPGISGSYILIIMGTYSQVLKELSSPSWFILFFLFIGGASLMTFSHGIGYLLKNHLSKTMAFLTGMMLGGALGLFPIKSITLLKDHGVESALFLLIGAVLVIGAQLKVIKKHYLKRRF